MFHFPSTIHILKVKKDLCTFQLMTF